ncbi:MAG: hypothetical protein N2376_13005 [Clostridia bacterium]|nr:hypothetical protein [Clostridia bacterium]
MAAEGLERRFTLAAELIAGLIEIRNHILKLTDDLGEESNGFLRKVYEDYSDKIKEKVALFNQNVEKVKGLNHDITNEVNGWYAFIKDEKALGSFLFPLRLYAKKKQVRGRIRELKQEISSIAIKTRLIREDIQRLQGDLEYEAAQRLKKDVRYEDYLSHLKLKSRLVEELNYLLPTLAGIPGKIIFLENLEETLAWIKLQPRPE